MAAHQALPSLGFSRQEHWSELPFPPPMHESEKWKWICSVVSDSWLPHGMQPTRLLLPQNSMEEYWSGVPLPSLLLFATVEEVCQVLWVLKGFPGVTSGKEPACQSKRARRKGFNPWVRKIPWRSAWLSTVVLLPENPHGQRSLAGGNPVSCRVRHDWSELAHSTHTQTWPIRARP